jgi:S1-C subfamily serine protease
MTIHTVYDGSPAARVGLKASDQLVRINNRVIGSQQEFFHTLHSSSGKAVLQVRRAGKLHEVNVVLQLARFGTLGTYLANGIRIDLLHPNTPASRAGVGPNDFILSVDNRVVANQAAFEAALDQSGGTWLVKVNKVGAGIGVLQVELMNNSLGCWCEPAVGGMRVLNSPQGTFANRLGLVKGDIIFQVDNRATQNLGALQDALENARGFMALDYRSALTGQVGRLNINLSQHFR